MAENWLELHRVHTPENVAFDFQVAGLASRAAAWGVDLLLMAGLALLATVLIGLSSVALGRGVMAVHAIVIFLIQWWYQTLFEWRWSGQTPGKRVFHIRVLSADGFDISFQQALIRNLVRLVDLLPFFYLVGGASVLIDKGGRRLGDIAADTIVIRNRRSPAPSAVVPESERYNSFIEDPLVIHAARRVSAPERDAMIELGLRREQLPLSVRHELFAQLADHLERRLGVVRPALFSDEEYVMNLAAVALHEAESEEARHAAPRGSQWQ